MPTNPTALQVSAAQAPAERHPCCLRAAFSESGRPQISQTPGTPPNPAPRSLRAQCSMVGIEILSARLWILSESVSLLQETEEVGSHIQFKNATSLRRVKFSQITDKSWWFALHRWDSGQLDSSTSAKESTQTPHPTSLEGERATGTKP